MTPQHPTLFGIELKQLTLPALLGASVPLILLVFLILADKEPFLSWMLIPLTITPSGGACGGIFFYLMGFVWFTSGKQKLIAVIFSTTLYFVAIWLSAVIAFNFTGHWN